MADYLARSDLTSFIPNFVQNWEEDFLREPANWGAWMETALNVTITNNVAAVPAGYLGLKVAYISGQAGPPLNRLSLTQLYSRYPRGQQTGEAKHIARNGTNFEFGPIPSGGTLVGTCYVKPTVLRTDSDGINFLITDAPDLCLYGSLIAAEPFIKNDARLPVWQSLYDRALMSYRNRFREEDGSGGPMFTVAV